MFCQELVRKNVFDPCFFEFPENFFYPLNGTLTQPRSQGFSLFVIGKEGKGPGTGRSHDFQHPDIVGVINYNNNELENLSTKFKCFERLKNAFSL
jgi:hypothetical protein